MPTPQPAATDDLPPDLKPIATFAAKYFIEKSEWPQVREVLRQGFGEVAEVEQRIQQLSGVVHGMIVGVVPSMDAKVAVDVAVMAQLDLPSARQFALDYVEFVTICARRFEQPNANLTLTSTELLSTLLEPHQSNERQGWVNKFVRLLYPFLQSTVERPGIWSGLGGNSNYEWNMGIGDTVRYFLKVHTLAEYLAARKQLLKQHRPQTVMAVMSASQPRTNGPVKTVFLVHGHDHIMRDKVELVLRRMGLEVLILSESAYAGRFTLQKFEEEAAKADFAVVLVTEDDLAAAKRDVAEDVAILRSQLQARGRQNVIWEWGYLFHKLGTRRICVLKAPGVEMFSDLLGRGYVEMSTGWEERLRQEIAAANQDEGA